MFDIGWGELVVIGVVALIVIGPKELPAVLRTIGQWTTKIRRMAGEFQSQFQEAMREAEMADLKKEVDNITNAAKDMTSSMTSQFDPLDLKDATPWEPKVEDRSADKVEKNDDTAPTAETSAAVPPDGDVPPAAAETPPAETAPVEMVPAEAGEGAAPAHPGSPGPQGSRPA